MEDCVQNLLILLLIMVLVFSITNYFKNKKMRNNIRTITDVSKAINGHLENIGSSINNEEEILVYPIDNNVLDDSELIDDNNNALVPESNVTIIEENKENDEKFNYTKEFSNNFNPYDPEEKYPEC